MLRRFYTKSQTLIVVYPINKNVLVKCVCLVQFYVICNQTLNPEPHCGIITDSVLQQDLSSNKAILTRRPLSSKLVAR